MKISFVTFACPDWSLEQAIDAAVQLEYQGIEFRCDARHQHGVEIYTDKIERRAIRQKLDRYELQIPCLGTSLRLVDESVVEQAHARLELASQIGTGAIRLFCGPRPEGWDQSQLIETAALHLRQIAQNAEGHHLQVWLETHDTLSLGADVAAVLELADQANLGVVYDPLHPYRMGEPVAQTLKYLGNKIRHVHFHDGFNDPTKIIIRPFGQGHMPLHEVMDGLLETGYDGYLSGEWFHDMYGPDPLEALTLYRSEVSRMLDMKDRQLGRTQKT